MSPLKIVLDTNALLRSISRRSGYSIVMDRLYEKAFELYLTNDILLEYEEKITDIFSRETAELTIGAFTLIPNIKKVDIHYHLNLIMLTRTIINSVIALSPGMFIFWLLMTSIFQF